MSIMIESPTAVTGPDTGATVVVVGATVVVVVVVGDGAVLEVVVAGGAVEVGGPAPRIVAAAAAPDPVVATGAEVTGLGLRARPSPNSPTRRASKATPMILSTRLTWSIPTSLPCSSGWGGAPGPRRLRPPTLLPPTGTLGENGRRLDRRPDRARRGAVFGDPRPCS